MGWGRMLHRTLSKSLSTSGPQFSHLENVHYSSRTLDYPSEDEVRNPCDANSMTPGHKYCSKTLLAIGERTDLLEPVQFLLANIY